MTVAVPLHRDQFTDASRTALHFGQLRAEIWRAPTGVEMLRIRTLKGHVTILPFMGQMLWDATFEGLHLGMSSQFDMPRSAPTIIGTYGCLGFHSGLLANGVPGPDDAHPVHGEFPTCRMDQATLFAGEDHRGRYVELWGRRNHVEGFGPHYDAEPTVRVYETDTMIDWGMRVTNRSAFPMPLQYMAHLNPAFLPGATIHQPAPFTPDRTQVRRAVPAHVTPNPDYLAFIDDLAADPAKMRVLDRETYDPEQVFYIRDPGTDTEGRAHLMLRRPKGDGIALSYLPAQLPKLVRWILANGDTQTAAFALPATSEPDGRTAELAKGNVIQLAPGARADFTIRFGYVSVPQAEALAGLIARTGGEA